jgi:hypothetical protein
MSSIPSWNEELVFEGVVYTMDSSNGVLYSPETGKEVGQWEPNYEYSVKDHCNGFVTWVDYHAEDHHDVDVSRSMALSFLQEQTDAATTIQKYGRRLIVLKTIEFPVDPTGFELIPTLPEEIDEEMTIMDLAENLWPKAAEELALGAPALRRHAAAVGFQEAYQKSRG